jgi:hypothetical protein
MCFIYYSPVIPFFLRAGQHLKFNRSYTHLVKREGGKMEFSVDFSEGSKSRWDEKQGGPNPPGALGLSNIHLAIFGVQGKMI